MKKSNILIAIFFSIVFIITLCSYHNGAAKLGLVECTGAEKSKLKGCTNGGPGCHSTTALTDIAVSIDVDLSGTIVHGYIPGQSYNVTIKGTNKSLIDSLPFFGFQLGCILGDTSSNFVQNAGFWDTTSLPLNTQFVARNPGLFDVDILEQNDKILATSGNGKFGTVYSKTFTWTAPKKGSGSVSFWGIVNAINNDNHMGGDFWNTSSLILSELDSANFSGNNNLLSEKEIKVFPNPTSNKIFIYSNEGINNIEIFNVDGNEIKNLNIHKTISGFYIEMGNLSNGIYILKLTTVSKAILYRKFFKETL